MMKVDGERTRGESERESERERERERSRERQGEREIEREEDRGRERERERENVILKLTKNYFALAKAKDSFLLRLSKAKDSYFGVSKATLFETVFETQKNYKKRPNKFRCYCVLKPKRNCFETHCFFVLRWFLQCFKLLSLLLIDQK